MKVRYRFTAVLSFLGLSVFGLFQFPASAAETYKVDSVHSYILFRIKHFDVGYSYGRFNGPSGSFVYDENSPSNSSIEIRVNAKDVDTAVEKRDNHLRSSDFFDAEKYLSISFKSNSVKKLDASTFEVSGDLNLLGKTRPVLVKARHTGAAKDPWGNHRRGFETTFTIRRSDFGMGFMMGALSDEVDLTVSIEGIQQ